MSKPERMEKVAEEIESCKICREGKSGKAVVGEGSLDAKIIFIGEAPGKTEAVEGRPFIGRSGKLLRSMITGIGLKESEVYITSPVKYLPDRGTPTSADIAHGRIHLMKQFEIIQPKLVVLLGRVAAEGVLQNPPSSNDFGRARKVQVMKEHGAIIDSREGVDYFLTLHPAAVLRFPWKFKKDFDLDFAKIKKII